MAKDEDDDLTTLEELQLGLVRMHQAAAESGARLLIVLEGRDTAGKDGAIRAITEHLYVRTTRVVALPKPSDRERTQWFFQRYVAQLPAAGEFVIFNRSWYNRAGVEVVNGFSTAAEQAQFLRDVPDFERILVENGITLIKFWLDISRAEQAERLADRRSDPLKVLKISPLDAVAEAKFDDYSDARDRMLLATHTLNAPWTCVHADNKKAAREAIIRHILRVAAPAEIARTVTPPDPDILFDFVPEAITDGRLAR